MAEIPTVQNEAVTNLYWTGGWDSTFRLLQLLLQANLPVQTYYLIDRNRPSAPVEIKSIQKISARLFKRYPVTRGLLLPTRFTEISSIKPSERITRAHREILKSKHLGEQYEWLARFCAQNQIFDMELSIVDDGAFHHFISNLSDPISSANAVESEPNKSDLFELFQFYTFPLINLSKLQMQQIAEERGWMELMRLTWFCHNPILGRIPCGKCRPCEIALEEGMGWRIPALVRMAAKTDGNRTPKVKSVAQQKP